MMDNRILIGLVVLAVLYLVLTNRKKPPAVQRLVRSEIVVELGPKNLAVLRYGGSLEGVELRMVQGGHDLTSKMGLNKVRDIVSNVVTFDLNRDGYSDLILGGPSMGLWIYENRLHGQFRTNGFVGNQIHRGTGVGIVNVLIHDFNRDGNADLMVYYADGSIKVFQNVGGAGLGGDKLSYLEVKSEKANEMAREMMLILEESPSGWSSAKMAENDAMPYKFAVKLPNNIEFANAKVMLRVGRQHVVKYNVAGMGSNGLVVFGFNTNQSIDGIKIRTIYGKAHSYARQKMGSVLVIDPVVKFDSQKNIHRSQSMG